MAVYCPWGLVTAWLTVGEFPSLMDWEWDWSAEAAATSRAIIKD
jgi:hypothetical protein